MISLERPSVRLANSYLDFIDERRILGEKIWDGATPKPSESLSDFVARMLLAETQPAAGFVAETTYWATENSQVVGRIALRHELNENLKEFGGHIGYEVHPRFRRRGIATEMLRLLLGTTRAKEIRQLLLTCAPDNIASNKTILANGGVLKSTSFVEKWQRQTNSYWIEIKSF